MTFKIGDIVTVGNGACDEGMEFKITSVTNTSVGGNATKVADQRPDIKVGDYVIYLHHFVIVPKPRIGPKPGDRVVVVTGAYKGCEGTVTFSVENGDPVILITEDPKVYDLGERLPMVAKRLRVIAPVVESNLHPALDDLLFNV